MTTMKGRVWKFGNNIDTDMILPAPYMTISDPQELGQHCMEGADKDFARNVQAGDIMVAGQNFGCGSSREHAPMAIKACGIACIIARSFARIFFRNAINIGLPILECAEAAEQTKPQDEIEVNLKTGVIKNITNLSAVAGRCISTQAGDKSYQAKPFPDFIQGIIASGGLMEYIKEKEKNRV